MYTADLLRGRKTRLTALVAADLAVIARWYQDANFMRLLDATPAYPKTEAALNRDWLEEMQKAKDAFLFGVRLLEDDALVGFIELDGILWTHQNAWLGIGLDPAHWEQGYGQDALRLALGFAFRELNLHRVQLTVFDYNQRAIAVYEKLGFRREGVFREFLQRDGEHHDMVLYGLLRREWQQEPS